MHDMCMNNIIVQVVPQVGELVRDLRKLMSPFTASNLREKRYMYNYMVITTALKRKLPLNLTYSLI